jgi:hypothetical protein
MLSPDDLSKAEEAMERLKSQLQPRDYTFLRETLDSYLQIAEWAAQKDMTTDRLRELVFGTSPEGEDALADHDANGSTSESTPAAEIS